MIACEMTHSCVLERQDADHVLVYSCRDKSNLKKKKNVLPSLQSRILSIKFELNLFPLLGRHP